MRSLVLSVPLCLALGGVALAQGASPNGPPPLPPASGEQNYQPPLPPSNGPPATMGNTGNGGGMTTGGQFSGMGGMPGADTNRPSEPLSNRAANLNQGDQAYQRIAPALPSPAVAENAGPESYLHAAQSALAAGNTGEAQQSLEMAQTRLLDRSVPYGQTNMPSHNPAIDTISQALQALASGDQGQTMNLIQTAINQAHGMH